MLRKLLAGLRLAGYLAAGLTILVGCEKDYEVVAPYHELLPVPTNVEAQSAQSDRISVSWDVADPDSLVRGFVVAIADTGRVLFEAALEGAGSRAYTTESSSLFDATQVDSAWYFVQVRAYDSNLFQGAFSLPDSVLIP
jgi:hypothetical protein